MRITSDWIKSLAEKKQIRPKAIRDELWPKQPTRGLSYFDKSDNCTRKYIEKLCDLIGCTADELLRRDHSNGTNIVSGNNNNGGTVTISSDVKVLQDTIKDLREIISRQDLELSRKDAELKAKNSQIDRLINLVKGNSK